MYVQTDGQQELTRRRFFVTHYLETGLGVDVMFKLQLDNRNKDYLSGYQRSRYDNTTLVCLVKLTTEIAARKIGLRIFQNVTPDVLVN